MRFFCPNCWHEVKEKDEVCENCGLNIAEYSKKTDYIEKLINALHSPVASTALMAVWLLGELKDERAIQALSQITKESKDLVLVKAAAEALEKIRR